MQTIEYIDTMNIRSSDLNPRKTFDENAIAELSKSITEVGILQPIIVRLSHYKKGTESFEIVCGERRWRAARLAELKTVPAIVRELKDQEALDLMITENLQRKDVSPLEEAEAFQNLITHRKYDIPTLVTRFGKSEYYIRHRLKLNDLIPEFKALMNQEVIGLGHATEICKLQDKDQKELYEKSYSEEARGKYWWTGFTIKQLKSNIESEFTLKLDEASFNLDDKTLDKKAGPCTSCPKNTASNLILFPDSPSSGICLDRACFKHKSDIHYDRELKRVQEDEPGVILAYPSYVYGDDDKKLKELAKKGVEAIEVSWNSGWSEVSEPELPEKPEESEFDEPDEYQEALSDFDLQMNDYAEEVKEYQEKLNSGTLRKAFMLVGRDKGKFVYLEPKATSNSGAGGSAETDLTKKQIDDLKSKDKRNQELTFEKFYNAAKDLIKQSNYSTLTDQLTEKEWTAIYVLMLSRIDDELEVEIYGDQKNRYIKNEQKLPAALRLTPEQGLKVIRNWLRKELWNANPLYMESESKALIEIARERYPEQITQVELELQGKYLKRKEKIDQQIAELNKK